MLTPDDFNSRGADYLPGHLGLVITQVSGGEVRSELHVKKLHLAPNGYLHAGTVITLADTVCGYGCAANLPEGAAGFTIWGPLATACWNASGSSSTQARRRRCGVRS